jgi:diadenosine tetraphosphatase ApaH/serine/threonine PP2A family protein phosphatase
MRILVISDIHANYTALEAVLKDAGAVDETWCLGDMVGYGPDPNAVVEEIRDIPNLTCILGNHDMAAIGKIPLEAFNGDARRALEYHEKVLSASNMDFLRALPHNLKVRGEVSLVHGSPRDSVWEYILNTLSARLNFDHFTTPWCFVGHSHLQCMFQLDPNTDRVSLSPIRVDEHVMLRPRAILNPGSVGQPRDRDPRAAYAIFDTVAKIWEPRRAAYNISEVQARIREAGLPEKQAIRIAEGW